VGLIVTCVSACVSCCLCLCLSVCLFSCVHVFYVCGCCRVVACVCAASACRLMRATAGGWFNTVDLYNSATGVWSTARLSVARANIAATSVGNVAIVAGGEPSGGVLLCIEGELRNR